MIAITRIRKRLYSRKARSAWQAGVREYAVDILERMREQHEGETIPNACLERELLCGAENWSAYSRGGFSLIYDEDIAERLCNNTELKRRKGGRLPPNKAEDWIDVQARALYQAANWIENIVWADDVRCEPYDNCSPCIPDFRSAAEDTSWAQ